MHISPASRPLPSTPTPVQASTLLKKHLGAADARIAKLMGIDLPPRKSDQSISRQSERSHGPEKSQEKSISRQSERSGGSEKSQEKSISRQSERSGGPEKSQEKSPSRQSERSGGSEKSEESISRKSAKK